MLYTIFFRLLTSLRSCICCFWGHKWLLVLLFFSMVLQNACSQRMQPAGMPQAMESEVSSSRYLFTPGDVIEVIVWKNPDLSREVTVRSDGKISMPLIGDIHAAGFTTDELSNAIGQELLTYYKEAPEVSIIVQQATQATIYILGEVVTQGKFAVTNGTTLLQAIALAGGFSEFASRNNIIMRRKGIEGEEVTFGFRYKNVLAGREKNIVVQDGDTIIVQ